MTLPTAQTIERFAISYAAAQGVRWAEVSAETARSTRAGVAAGLMSMRVEGSAAGAALAEEMIDGIAADLRLLASSAGGEMSETLSRIAVQVETLRTSDQP